jgi:hypothetical protein
MIINMVCLQAVIASRRHFYNEPAARQSRFKMQLKNGKIASSLCSSQ